MSLPGIPGHRVLRLVARGGFGLVFEGEREVSGVRVAIKVARDDRLGSRAFLGRERAALSRIGPPHVPAVLEHGETAAGAPYLVMEYVAAQTLADRLGDRASPLSPAEAALAVAALLGALEHVHAGGYVHCDLKPENVFVDGAARATLVDFGLAAPAGYGPADVTQERAGAGTAEYMAPEQCEGAPDVDARADLYAVGIILFELLAGRPPFWGARAEVLESHLSRRPPRISAMAEGLAIPASLADVVARALAKDRDERFGSAAEMRAALLATLRDGAAAGAPSPSSWRPPAAVGPARGERATAGLLFFQSSLDVAVLKVRLEALGGQIGEVAGRRCVAVFTGSSADNPARRALRAAEELVRLGACDRARVDLAPITVRARRDGTPIFISALFSRADRFPAGSSAEGHHQGVEITPAAAAVLEEAGVPARSPDADPAGAEITPLAPPAAEARPAEALLGREALLARLVESARRAASDAAPTLVRLVAEPGLGKSHLARVLAGHLGALGGTVLTLRAREPALGDVDRALADLLVLALDVPATPPPDGGDALLRERLGPEGAAFAPAVAFALGWLAIAAGDPEGSPLAAALRAQGAAPGALRATLGVAAGGALRRRAEAGPLFVIVDDAQFAGSVVLDALEVAALAEAPAPLWICALGRPLFERERPSFGLRAARREEIALGPLDPESAATLCRRLLFPVESAPASAVRRLVERAQGSPLLLVELARGLHREGLVRRSPAGDAFYLATDELDRLPDSPLIEWLARRELDALAPPLRGHARLLALLGEQVTFAEVEGVLRRLEWQGGDVELPLDAKIGTRRLLAARVVLKDDEGRLQFRHALVREAVARAVPAPLRRRIHAAAAEVYAAGALGLGEEGCLAQLAYHAGEAGVVDQAARSYFALAERARARHAFTDAERLYSRALEQPGAASAIDRTAAHRGRGLMRYRIGRYHDALADLGHAREAAARAGDVAEQIAILLDEAIVLDWMGRFQSSEERVAEAQALVTKGSGPASPLLEARALLGLGGLALRASRNEEAAALLSRAASVAEPLGDDGYETQVIALFQLGFLLSCLGRADEARHALDRSVALAEERGDLLHLGGALNARGVLWGSLGDVRRLVADVERSLSIARELGQASLEFVAEFNLAELLLVLDDDRAAEPHLRRVQALDRRISGDPGRADVALLSARLCLYRGEARAALEIVARLRTRQDEARARGEALLGPPEDVFCGMIELSLGDAAPAAWDALEERAAASVAQERLEVVEARGVAAARRGHAAEARSHYERALALAGEAPNAMKSRLARRVAETRRGPA